MKFIATISLRFYMHLLQVIVQSPRMLRLPLCRSPKHFLNGALPRLAGNSVVMLSEANRRSQLRIMHNLRVGDLRLTAFRMTNFPSKPVAP